MQYNNNAIHNVGFDTQPGPSAASPAQVESVWAEVYMTRLRQMSRSLAGAERDFKKGFLHGPPRGQQEHAASIWSSPSEPLSAFAM